MRSAEIYDSIDDWTREGRRRLAETRGDEIRWMLDAAFTSFVDAERVGLSAFGFHSNDPVAEAVDFCVERFSSGDIDPARLPPRSRSFLLFTEVRFWLCQRVGRLAYRNILANLASATDSLSIEAERVPVGDEGASGMERVLDVFARELGATLSELIGKTCADIGGFWLEGTARMRSEWFGWREAGRLSEEGSRLSRKQRSFCLHDAMFRFLCLLHALLEEGAETAATSALRLTMFSPCDNTPPYRVPDRDVLTRLSVFRVTGSREVARLRREAASACLRRCLDRATGSDLQEPTDRLRAELPRGSIGLTTLHALGLEQDAALHEKMNAIQSETREKP